ncbi:MAG: penicillin-binding protein activator [Alphaproteobacteria bacterium]|nr:penicillin-binding protein activator [Alphaproteobacteria bacterium]MCB9692558.1 penicillin-binding protein activator [Alphaproteobacteria bacterium]
MTLIALLSLLSPAHAGRKPVVPDAVEDALAYVETDRAKAIQILEAALADAKPKTAGLLEVHVAEQYRLSGEADTAREHFQAAVDSGDKSAKSAGEVGLVLLASSAGVDARGLQILEKADERALTDTQNADRLLLLAVDAARRDDAKAVGANTKRALALAKLDPATAERIPAAVEALKTGNTDVEVTGGAEKSLLDRARTSLEKGDRQRAAELARQALAEAEEGSDDAMAAKYLERRATTAVAVDPKRITVLLPLSGKYEGAAKQVREAFEMGYQASGGTHQLVFVDTGATPESAVAALEKAVLDEGSVAVVGPLLSDTTEVVVKAAQAMEVPLLSLSQSNEEKASWVLQGVPSVGDQTAALVKHVMVQENMKRFAIFAPDTAYGHRAAESFRANVEERKGTISAEVFYDPEANALMPFAAKLGKKDDPARKGELWRLKKAAEDAGRDPGTIVLPPTIDYEAIFVPDSARKIPIACAALAYEEFPVGEFRPRAGETLIPLLGLNGWNQKGIVSAGGEYVRNSRFTDAWLPSDSAAFAAQYKEKTGRTPTSLEAVTVDAGRLLGAASRIGGADRAAFRDALKGAKVSGSTTGLTGLQEGRPDTPIAILTITKEGIQPLGGSEETPTP